jgi:hypothetical protein
MREAPESADIVDMNDFRTCAGCSKLVMLYKPHLHAEVQYNGTIGHMYFHNDCYKQTDLFYVGDKGDENTIN